MTLYGGSLVIVEIRTEADLHPDQIESLLSNSLNSNLYDIDEVRDDGDCEFTALIDVKEDTPDTTHSLGDRIRAISEIKEASTHLEE